MSEGRRPPWFPLFLDVAGRLCVVIGCGGEAAGRVLRLVECGARVRLVAERLPGGLEPLLAASAFEWLARAYRPGDLEGAFLAGADDTPTVNAAIWREAERERILLNAADDRAHCHAIVPSLLRRGDLAIAVSTAGRSPALAIRIRRELEERYGPEYEEYVDLLGRLRDPVAVRLPDREARRAFWHRLVDSDLLELVRAGDDEAIRARVESELARIADRHA